MDVISKTIDGNITELTLISKIIPAKLPALKAFLQMIQADPGMTIARISTIHYARWVLFDNDTRLLFCSNFDGSFEAYLQDFAEKLPQGLDGIWGNCEGYPGCNPFGPFMEWVRSCQIEVICFYAAYPKSTVKDVFKALDWQKKTLTYMQELAKPPAGN
jgi:hypothetical protein